MTRIVDEPLMSYHMNLCSYGILFIKETVLHILVSLRAHVLWNAS